MYIHIFRCLSTSRSILSKFRTVVQKENRAASPVILVVNGPKNYKGGSLKKLFIDVHTLELFLQKYYLVVESLSEQVYFT